MQPTNGQRLLASVLQCSVQEVPPYGSMETVSGWDSLAHMRLAAALEERLSRDLTSEELLELESVEDIDRLLG
ncbi:phosphopantetheine-binding protein [Marivibrio sp.]|uniref:phosphopantetheine-binding protein n=1 Tax=Marivibrio sp. TaxID=2039719 RepID=UPI0032EAB857